MEIWESGNLGIGDLGTWKSRNLEIWGPGSPEILRSGDLEIQKLGVQKINKKDLKIQIRSAQNVGKVWVSRKKSSWPYLAPSHAIFPWAEQTQKNICLHIFLGALTTLYLLMLPKTNGTS